MTTRYVALTVYLDSEIREDDIEAVMGAIRMMKRVIKVEPYRGEERVIPSWAKEVARRELTEKILDALKPE